MEHFSDSTIPQKPRPTGKGIGIAILDTGISPVADFTIPANRIAIFRDFINGRTMPYDDNGHGTHVTGAKKHMIKKQRPCDTRTGAAPFHFLEKCFYVGVRDYLMIYWNMRNATSMMMHASTMWLQNALHHCIFFAFLL